MTEKQIARILAAVSFDARCEFLDQVEEQIHLDECILLGIMVDKILKEEYDEEMAPCRG